jgi:hypothetical protein
VLVRADGHIVSSASPPCELLPPFFLNDIVPTTLHSCLSINSERSIPDPRHRQDLDHSSARTGRIIYSAFTGTAKPTRPHTTQPDNQGRGGGGGSVEVRYALMSACNQQVEFQYDSNTPKLEFPFEILLVLRFQRIPALTSACNQQVEFQYDSNTPKLEFPFGILLVLRFQRIPGRNQQVDKHQQQTHQKRLNNETKSATHNY